MCEEGTILRLIKDGGMKRKSGALAVVNIGEVLDLTEQLLAAGNLKEFISVRCLNNIGKLDVFYHVTRFMEADLGKVVKV